MKTEILKMNENDIDIERIKQAARIISDGGVVAFPTETVYGLGANALNDHAIKRIYNAKGRPSDNPLIVHISDLDQLSALVRDIPNILYTLAERFCPGPLTMILKKSSKVPYITTGGLETVAIRIPKNKIALELIKAANLPIAAPSANISGRPSPTCGEHVTNDLNGKVDMIIDGGCCQVGLESTVLDLTQEIPMILRPGAITLDNLKEVIGKVDIDKSILNSKIDVIPKSPGMKYKHYAPNADIIIVQGDMENTIDNINRLANKYASEGKKVGIMATDEAEEYYQNGQVISLGSREDLNQISSNLFTVLRQFDTIDVDIILAEAFESVGVGLAIMNRLSKAAAHNIIKV